MDAQKPDVTRREDSASNDPLEVAPWGLTIELPAPVALYIDVTTGAGYKQLLQIGYSEQSYVPGGTIWSAWITIINGEYYRNSPNWDRTNYANERTTRLRIRGYAYDQGFIPSTNPLSRPGIPDWRSSRIRTLPNTGGELYVFGFNDWGGGADDANDQYDDMFVKIWPQHESLQARPKS